MEKDAEVEYQQVNRDSEEDRKKTLFFEFPLQLDINHCTGVLSACRLRGPRNMCDLSSWIDVVKRSNY